MSRSVLRRAIASVALAFIVAAIVIGNIPASALRTALDTVTEPFREVAGIEQFWAMYSNPRDISAYVDGHVDNADGTSIVYAVPGNRGMAAYSDYRWQKYMEMIRPDDGKSLWPAYAEYLADRARSEGHDPVRVTLVRRWAQTLPPGPGPAHGPWQEVTIYVRDVRSS
ncbi:hypothetical protein [Mycobacterium aquaticum]|uniref:Uncharacterized protein n=1 Tax=Mycobacterium aquaticum TaxID=1927124 RepID=A0A1W9ZUN7_9MYCO|nr:hypothetical protein [Mycobacterium aquaticum]ORA21375.1 hypothetical protein BST13_37650 [Mycobacterium aquaticum]